ncbi:MAG TPA: anti-sigma factor [Acidimicrobiales bacterium]|nr:anti-sigma factor [Acidimicrobiales bacterium]
MTGGAMTSDHEQMQSLLGAYALHAVEPDEARLLDEHVAGCPRCRAELTGYLRAAPLLGSTSEEPPAGLWDEVASTIGDGRAADMPTQVRRALWRRRWWSVGPTLAAAFGVVVVVLGTLVGTLATGVIGGGNGPNGTPAQLVHDAAIAAMAGPHRTIALQEPGGRARADVVIASGTRGFFVPLSLPELGRGRTYQLWASVRGAAVSLGTVGGRAQTVAFHVEPAMAAFMITAEPAGGVAQPDSPVLAVGRNL